ncbi:SRPBCC family protein [Mucilaginibacter sp. dw_454]|uniref:SRPBCC family protein n=1 Tax=Mucilaginibacter sp. dw_454 TaxID=2720079 RepID=UPI001BD2398B|nr:SRPBCC family protein [Mucilaginibacter sp. dw_454]
MAIFESKISVNRPVSDVYQFLADFNNHGQLMPDSVQDWAATYNDASFMVQNTIKLSLQIAERIENKAVNILAVNNPPFPIQLNWSLEVNGDATDVIFTIDAELNMMMKMMVSGPLQKLANHEAESLASLLSSN